MFIEQDSRRRSYFREVADLTVDVTGSGPDDVVRAVLARLDPLKGACAGCQA